MVTISRITARRNGNWREIELDNGEKLKLPSDVVPAGVSAGATLTAELELQLRQRANYHGLLDTALRMLGRREHFAGELERKLRQRSMDRELNSRIVGECLSRGFIDDARAAEALAESLLSRRAMGLGRLKNELFRRGCPPELSVQILERYREHFETTAALDAAIELARRRFTGRVARELEKAAKSAASAAGSEAGERTLERLQYAELRKSRQRCSQQLAQFLATRGFSGESSRQAAALLLDELFDAARPDR
jgi:regulatory protein